MKSNSIGVIHGNEAYSKSTVLQRLGISQRFWDHMLDEGLPFSRIGHTRWVTGRDLIEGTEAITQLSAEQLKKIKALLEAL